MAKKKRKERLLEPLKSGEVINIAHKIRLEPNNVQKTYMNKAIGCARLAYNWALAEWKRAYGADEKPNVFKVRKSFNAIRMEQFPFTYEVAKSVTSHAIADLGQAFINFFRGTAQYPVFKKKSYTQGSFYIDGFLLKFKTINKLTNKEIKGQYVLIPKLGYVKMSERLRFNGKINSCVISRKANNYYISFSMEISQDEFNRTHKFKEPQHLTCGVDIGSISAISLDNGYKVKPPKPLSKANKRYKRLSRQLSRKQHPSYKGDKTERSKNFIKATRRLAKFAEHIANIRKDFNHKETSKVVADHKFIAMETLNVTGMVKNRKLAKSISDVSYSDLSSKIEYKARYSNRYIYYADMFFASSKTCLNCLDKNSELKLSDRIFICPSCGFTIDRDTAAAINLREEMERYLIGIAHPEFTLVERSSVDDRSLGYLRSTFSMKQEDSINLFKE
jgi:transposase, IS605 orfB family